MVLEEYGKGSYRGIQVFAFGKAALGMNRAVSYTFFDRLGGLVKTGPTGTNVMDLQIAAVAS